MLSIIVPVYNVKDYLERCLQSIDEQKFDDYEVIVIDDGSFDGSEKIVDRFCDGKTKFKVIHKQNGGLMSAWVAGVKVAQGDYLGFVDSDDYIAADMFPTMYSIVKEQNIDIIMCDYGIENVPKRESGLVPGIYMGENLEKIKKHLLPEPGKKGLSMARWNKLFKKELLISNLKYCESLSKTFEDRYIVPACIYSAKSFYYLDEIFYFYELREGSNSGMYKPNLIEEILRMYGVQEQALKDKGLFEECKANWEKAFLDYIRLYVHRNIINIKGFNKKVESAKKLFNNSTAQDRLEKYGHLLQGKLGKSLILSYKLHAPFFLALCSYIV